MGCIPRFIGLRRVLDCPVPADQHVGQTEVGQDGIEARDDDQNQACHSIEPGQNKVGPSLFGIVGAEAGTAEGFNYSAATRDSDVVWTPENLDSFLANPRGFMPGTKMIFPGLSAAEDRYKLIAYLLTEAPPEEAATEVPAPEASVAGPAPDVPEAAPAGYTATVRYGLKTAIAGGRKCMSASAAISTEPSIRVSRRQKAPSR